MEATGWLDRGDGTRLAWAHLAGSGPTLVFLPGFKSDMQGSKALALRDFAASRGKPMLRLDYSGHGSSDGAFTDGSIGRWTADALCVIAAKTTGPLVLVGSSMGGWIALLLARHLGARIAGYVGIAAAPDFTEDLMWQAMAPPEQAALLRHGRIEMPSDYGEPLVITRHLIEEGRAHLLLGAPITIACPCRLLQGQMDPDVPWETALKLARRLDAADVQTILIKDGDHRLSRPADLALLAHTVASLLGEDGSQA